MNRRLDSAGYSYSITFELSCGLPVFVGKLFYGGLQIAVTQGFSHEGCSTQLMAIYRKRKRKQYSIGGI